MQSEYRRVNGRTSRGVVVTPACGVVALLSQVVIRKCVDTRPCWRAGQGDAATALAKSHGDEPSIQKDGRKAARFIVFVAEKLDAGRDLMRPPRFPTTSPPASCVVVALFSAQQCANTRRGPGPGQNPIHDHSHCIQFTSNPCKQRVDRVFLRNAAATRQEQRPAPASGKGDGGSIDAGALDAAAGASPGFRPRGTEAAGMLCCVF